MDIILHCFIFRDEEFKDESGSSRHGSYMAFKPNIDELEMLLEAYFVQIVCNNARNVV